MSAEKKCIKQKNKTEGNMALEQQGEEGGSLPLASVYHQE